MFLLQTFGDRLLLCGEIDPNIEKTPLEEMGRERSPGGRERLLLSGDIESNPGPSRRLATLLTSCVDLSNINKIIVTLEKNEFLQRALQTEETIK